MYNTELKTKLRENELTIGSWITIGHPNIVEILAEVGFDWLTIDLEHSVIDLYTTQILISTIQAYGIAALVRVSKNEEVIIKRVLDAGADGIIIPMINSRMEAEQAVNLIKYPPKGKRGVGLSRAQKYGFGFDNYKTWLDKNVVIIAQIEHIDAVNNIDDILMTKDIDGIIIGPYDLSGSFGIPGDYKNEKIIDSLKKVEQACKKATIPLGFHVIEPDAKLLNQKIKDGYKFIAFSTDFLFMGTKAREQMININTLKKK